MIYLFPWLMAARLFHSPDLDDMKEALTPTDR